MKKHFAFVSVPAAGHVNPTLPLVAELLRRGHRVSYAVGHGMAPAVKSAGAELVELPTELPKPGRGPLSERMGMMLDFFCEDLRASIPVLRQRFAADPPDAVCADMMTPHGRMLAEELGVPAIVLMPSMASNEHFSMLEAAPPGEEFPAELFTEMNNRIEQVAGELGVRPVVPFQPQSGELNLVFLPREFQRAGETFDERYHFIGPLLGERDQQPWQPRDPQAPLLYIALGTAFNDRPDFYRMCLNAFGDSRWQVAMSIGHDVTAGDLGPVPDNFEVRASFPQPAVLRHASAFVSHTGMNSTMESLHAAVPLVAVPQMPEQAINAARVQELGLGRHLDPGTVTAEVLRAAVEDVAADESIRANLENMRRIVRSSGGAAAGAEALENHLA
ncbi:glycosyltransferase, MGT family [Saccharopolyspora kobensis]|uniref:Glycosyltransferase, MGT family n=1 Tax=Saccharopolyspora kobensis TaxID=146035 RepID=A0A1H5WS35_9PSEU|nr:macrolide family glycosyltransferase [Saccharopolyspora kobensis]SEG02399.1 glycosyltransferase, MGT family [Saccharopolyspora kobensis]SFD79184.1 glycosyltransferase, MGT family [Saccharopolyspora kobensis]